VGMNDEEKEQFEQDTRKLGSRAALCGFDVTFGFYSNNLPAVTLVKNGLMVCNGKVIIMESHKREFTPSDARQFAVETNEAGVFALSQESLVRSCVSKDAVEISREAGD
jgi:hypothetical protein